MKKRIKILNAGDLHIGAVPSERFEKELDLIIETIKEELPDVVILNGDIFHYRLNLDSSDSKLAMKFLTDLCDLTGSLNIILRVIKGTLTHDYSQLENYIPLEEKFPHFGIASTVCSEELFPDFFVLWVPEEYPNDYKSYYNEFFYDENNNPIIYDAIFGHGEIDVAGDWSNRGTSESEKYYVGTPIHSAETLLNHSKSVVAFGHIHVEFLYKKRLYYPGSFSRFAHGEEEAKGFTIITLTRKEDNSYDINFKRIENKLAGIYQTINYLDIINSSMELDEMVNIVKEACKKVTKLRIKFEPNHFLSLEQASVFRGALVNERNLQIDMPAFVPKTKTENTDENIKDEENFSYIRNTTIPLVERIQKFTNENTQGNTLSKEDIIDTIA